ncbi:hypothetical protein SLS62_000602 [Diatrype stigma]|uniref:lytic cellulose monooxygenase (C4-dehydrogenating) n=1 Tax=Diatrype stigma TaxID=117547 RepID=A0AAN9V1Z0_9PEZI
MSPSFSTAAALLGLAASATVVLAHGHVREVVVNGKAYPGYEPWAKNKDSSQLVTWSFTTDDEGPVPVSKLGSADIICHADAKSAKAHIPVQAGDEIKVRRFNEIGGFEHPGPELHYLASCGGSTCDQVDKASLEFVKFYEKGLVKGGQPDDQVWATTEVHQHVTEVDGGYVDEFTVRLPADTPSGNYVLRHELFGLHKADRHEAEFYPQCINLEVTSNNTGSLPKGTPATELYKADDAGIDLDIWVNLKSYQIPGPVVASSLVTTSSITTKELPSHPRDFRLRN